MNNKPSLFTIESIEPSIIFSLSKDNYEKLQRIYPELKDGFQDLMFQRFKNYSQLFLSQIKYTPGSVMSI